MITFVKFNKETARSVISEYLQQYKIAAFAKVDKPSYKLWYFFYRRYSPHVYGLYAKTADEFELLHDVRFNFRAVVRSKRYVFIPYLFKPPHKRKYRLCMYYSEEVSFCNKLFNELKNYLL